MTALRILVLTCDGTDDGEVCDCEYGGDHDFVGSIARLRADAAADGWCHDSGRDLCPAHAGGTR